MALVLLRVLCKWQVMLPLLVGASWGGCAPRLHLAAAARQADSLGASPPRSLLAANVSDGGRSDGAPSDRERALGMRWRFRAGSPTPGAVVATDGSVYVPTHEGHVHAVGPNGAFRWSHNVHVPATGAVVAASGAVLVTTRGGRVHALLPGGTALWVHQAPFAIVTPPAVNQEGTAFFADSSQHAVAITSHGGTRWRVPLGGAAAAAPVVVGDEVVVATFSPELCWVEAGHVKNRVPLPAAVTGPLVAGAEGTVLAIATDVLVAAHDGQRLWESAGVWSAGFASRAVVTFGTEGLCWRERESGRATSCMPLRGEASAPLVVTSGDDVFVPLASGELLVVPRGATPWRVPVARTALSALALDEGRQQVVASAGDGVVAAVGIPNGSAAAGGRS